MMGQEIAIERIVIIAKEGLRPPVAALGDVIGVSGTTIRARRAIGRLSQI